MDMKHFRFGGVLRGFISETDKSETGQGEMWATANKCRKTAIEQ